MRGAVVPGGGLSEEQKKKPSSESKNWDGRTITGGGGQEKGETTKFLDGKGGAKRGCSKCGGARRLKKRPERGLMSKQKTDRSCHTHLTGGETRNLRAESEGQLYGTGDGGEELYDEGKLSSWSKKKSA